MLWIPITLAATALQVARNAVQRGLLVEAGPWGATLVRFLFGLPFAAVFLAIDRLLGGAVAPRANAFYYAACALGGVSQIVATAAMLVSMRRSSFALGSVFQQSSIPLAAVMGLAFGEHLSAWRWVGLVLVSGGIGLLGWPRDATVAGGRSAAAFGLVAGAGFAVSSNAFRQAAVTLEPSAPVFSALATLLVVQAMQSVLLLVLLGVIDRRALRVMAARWRESLPAGLFGAAASGLWFTAFAMSPAGPVRAVGVVETPLAALAGRRLFAERLASWQLLTLGLVGCGVCLAALG